MRGPVKPCEGRFSDELQTVLKRNMDRAQWANHTCEVCGLAVGATQVGGKWVPEQHWPSVKYLSSKPNVEKREVSENEAGREEAVVAGLSSTIETQIDAKP